MGIHGSALIESGPGIREIENKKIRKGVPLQLAGEQSGGLLPWWYVWVWVHGVVWCKYHLKGLRVVVVYVILNKNIFV